MKRYSIWKDNDCRKHNRFKKINCDTYCDVLIIGGGLTGISTYYHLKDSNLKVLLVDQNKIGMGVTANSTGKVTYLQGSIYNDIIKSSSIENASLYLKSQIDAIGMIKDIIKKNNIECDLVKSKSYVFTNSDSEVDKLVDMKEFLLKNNIKVIDDKNNLVDSKYMISVSNTYLFNPVKFIYGLINNCNMDNIFEDSSVKEIKREDDYYIVMVNDNFIKCKNVVIASHYPYFVFPYLFLIKGYLEKSYICSGKKKVKNVSLISYKKDIVSIRNYKDYIIYLRDSHNVSKKVDDKEHFENLFKNAMDLGIDYEYVWSNIDIMTNDSLPYIGEIKDGMYIASGYNTWGMTNGVLAGSIISDLINNKENKYSDLFSPNRKSIGNVLKMIGESYNNVVGIINGMVSHNDNIVYDKVDGDDICIYKDMNGEHKVYRKCPHMGCFLIFNEIEKTWDCPCHGSRFDIDGKCINGPSNYDISYKE